MMAALVSVAWWGVLAVQALADDNKPDFQKFVPNPTGHGFEDAGMTKTQGFDQQAQMSRFGIPDLNNPNSRELTDLEFDYAMEQDKYLAVLFYAYVTSFVSFVCSNV